MKPSTGWIITLNGDERGQWRVKFQGPLSWWKRALIECVGWTIKPENP